MSLNFISPGGASGLVVHVESGVVRSAARVGFLGVIRRRLWAKACKFDDVNPSSSFVAFSDDNPHIERLNRLP